MFEKTNIAVVGATGAVGEVMLEILAARGVPAKNIFPLASERSLGKQVSYGNNNIDVDDLATFDFSNNFLTKSVSVFNFVFLFKRPLQLGKT